MLQRQVPSTCPIQSGRRVVPAEGRNEKSPLTLAPVPPGSKIPRREKRRRRDTTGERGERKNPTRRRCPTEANTRAAGTERPGVKRRGRIPAPNNGPTRRDGKTSRRRPKAAQDGRKIRIQPGKVEERGGRCKEGEPGVRASEPRTQEGVEKRWAEVARFGSISIGDRC